MASGTVSFDLQVARPAPGGGFLLAGTTPKATGVPVTGASGGSIPIGVGDRLAAAFACSGDGCSAGVASRAAPAASYATDFGALNATTPRTPMVVPAVEMGYNATVALDAPQVTSLSPATGDVGGGTPVVVSGEHLAVATSVTVDGVPVTASPVADGNEKFVITMPPHAAGTANVAVTHGRRHGGVDLRVHVDHPADPDDLPEHRDHGADHAADHAARTAPRR